MTISLTLHWPWTRHGQVSAEPGHGLTPAAFDVAIHTTRCLTQLRSKDKDIEKYIYLSHLKDADPSMYYRLALDHMAEVVPLIYTPTIGDACLQFSHNYRKPEGLFISYEDKGKIGGVIRNWPHVAEARITVVTDGSRILGLGDLGVNGAPIAGGKLSLYVAGAGIRPSSTVPICLDVGVDTQSILDDPLYLGLRRKRISDAEMTEFMDEFMHELTTAFPKLLVQFEDFASEKAFKYLERYRNKYPVFNDDIQGTGAVVLSGFFTAAMLSSAASETSSSEHRVLFLGAGSAGVGVAMQLTRFFTMQGLSEEEARERVYLVDSHGLVYDSRGPMAEHKKHFSRKDYHGPPMTKLLDIIAYMRPTALLGLSTIKGAFTPEVIAAMAALNPRPIIFPLSNPVKNAECEFHEAVEHTHGTVLFASGSPFPEMQYQGRTHYPGQGNNMYIFPGLGLGAILSRATTVTDSMVEASSLGLANSLNAEEKSLDMLYPRIERIREISAIITTQVIRAAQTADVDRSPNLRKLSDDELLAFVKSKMWNP